MASLVQRCLLRKDAVFLSFSVKYRVKNSKHEFTNIIHQYKQGFDGKKRTEGQTGRNSLHFNNMCSRVGEVGYRHARFKTVFLARFSRLFSLLSSKILQNNLLDLYLVEIRRYKLSFFAKEVAKTLTHRQPFFQSLKDRCVKLKLPGGWKLGPYLAKPINFLWAKFGGNRK